MFLATAAAFVTATRTGATLDECDQICGPSADCSEACLHVPPDPYPAFETTCGEYDGGAESGWCYDPQACGDGVCDNINDNEDAGNCSEDCGDPLSAAPTCGLYDCELGESCWTCPQGCGDCDDEGNPDPDDGESRWRLTRDARCETRERRHVNDGSPFEKRGRFAEAGGGVAPFGQAEGGQISGMISRLFRR
jgi:hypothetical protein